MQKIQKQVGARIRELRNARGWSQEELAERAGLHSTFIGQVERGERNLALSNLKKLADAFELSLSEMIELPKGKPTQKRALEGELIMRARQLNAAALRFVLRVIEAMEDLAE